MKRIGTHYIWGVVLAVLGVLLAVATSYALSKIGY